MSGLDETAKRNNATREAKKTADIIKIPRDGDLDVIAGRKLSKKERAEIEEIIEGMIKARPEADYAKVIRHKEVLERFNEARVQILKTIVGDRILKILQTLTPDSISSMQPSERRRWFMALAGQGRAIFADQPLIALQVNVDTKDDVEKERAYLAKLMAQGEARVIDVVGEEVEIEVDADGSEADIESD